MTKYKVGDVVKVREDLKCHERYEGVWFVHGMSNFRGKIVKIVYVNDRNDRYKIDGTNYYWWSSEMFVEEPDDDSQFEDGFMDENYMIKEEYNSKDQKLYLNIKIGDILASNENVKNMSLKYEIGEHFIVKGFSENNQGDLVFKVIDENGEKHYMHYSYFNHIPVVEDNDEFEFGFENEGFSNDKDVKEIYEFVKKSILDKFKLFSSAEHNYNRFKKIFDVGDWVICKTTLKKLDGTKIINPVGKIVFIQIFNEYLYFVEFLNPFKGGHSAYGTGKKGHCMSFHYYDLEKTQEPEDDSQFEDDFDMDEKYTMKYKKFLNESNKNTFKVGDFVKLRKDSPYYSDRYSQLQDNIGKIDCINCFNCLGTEENDDHIYKVSWTTKKGDYKWNCYRSVDLELSVEDDDEEFEYGFEVDESFIIESNDFDKQSSRIRNYVNYLNQTELTGNEYFNKIDEIIRLPKNIEIIKAIFDQIRKEQGDSFNLILTGNFGDWILNLIKKGILKVPGNLVLANGSIRGKGNALNKMTYGKEVDIIHKRGDISNQKFVLLDDSYYSGSTKNALEKYLKKLNSYIYKTYVIYDGNDKKDKNRTSMYRYYDYNTGTQLPVDKLLQVLYDKIEDDIPKDSIRDNIINGNIKTANDILNSVNRIKSKFGLQRKEVDSRTLEGNIFKPNECYEIIEDMKKNFDIKNLTYEEDKEYCDRWTYTYITEDHKLICSYYDCLLDMQGNSDTGYDVYLDGKKCKFGLKFKYAEKLHDFFRIKWKKYQDALKDFELLNEE